MDMCILIAESNQSIHTKIHLCSLISELLWNLPKPTGQASPGRAIQKYISHINQSHKLNTQIVNEPA